MKLSFYHSWDINEYEPILKSLEGDFGMEHYEAIQYWCDNEDHNHFYKYWDMRLVKANEKLIGICGLYYMTQSTKEAWIGWFGILPVYRGLGLGARILAWMELEASIEGAYRIMAYVGEDGPLDFYLKYGFKRLSSVKEYLEANPFADPNEFGEPNDHVIYKNLYV